MKLVATIIAALGMASASAAQPEPVTAIVDTTVLPMTGNERLTRQTVIVSGDRIVAVGPARTVKVPAGARRIDGRGKVLMPGLVDMHIHLAPVAGEDGDAAQRSLSVMLAHGVTTARTMAGSPENLVVRSKVESGVLAGPRIYAAAPALHEKSAPGAEQARAAVAQAKAAGFDLIKSHHLPDPAVWQAVQDEAKAQRIAVAGHVANSVGLERAIAAGQQVEHLDSVVHAMLPDDASEKQMDFGQVPPPPVTARALTVSDAELARLAKRVAAAKSWHVPTLSLFEKISDVETPVATLLADPAMRFVPKPALQQWAGQREQMKGMFTPADAEAFRELRRRITRAFHGAGVPLMAGSDTAQAFHIWGPGLHQEIAALAAAGLSPMEALRSGTVVPRDYFRSLPNGGSALGWKADFGTVEAGARADLILLAADPSKDLSVLARPETVIAGGRVYLRPELDRMLTKAAADASAAGPQKAAAAALPKPVYIVRHLQKGEGDDPSLSAEGAANARKLAAVLKAAGISAIFATPTKRAMETAAPLAQALGLSVAPYDPGDEDALFAAAAAAPGPVLIVGHSNTVPDLVARFGGAKPAPLTEQDYGTLFLVKPDGGVATSELR